MAVLADLYWEARLTNASNLTVMNGTDIPPTSKSLSDFQRYDKVEKKQLSNLPFVPKSETMF